MKSTFSVGFSDAFGGYDLNLVSPPCVLLVRNSPHSLSTPNKALMAFSKLRIELTFWILGFSKTKAPKASSLRNVRLLVGVQRPRDINGAELVEMNGVRCSRCKKNGEEV
jgi:hypothetical protein